MDGPTFEQEVRKIARLLWSEGAYSGAKTIDERERDGIFETRDAIHVVESTISRSMQKAIDDAKKTAALVQKWRRTNHKHVNGWLVTKDEPTADQRTALDKFSHSLKILSFDQFRSLLFNGSEYLRCRENYRFGSAADPVTKSATDLPSYSPVDLYDERDDLVISVSEIIATIKDGKSRRTTLIGEYGSGKSMTLRYLFIELAKLYRNGVKHVTPVYLNLREHTGQRDPVEVLERHARLIGYSLNAGDLVRAWRSGHVTLFLDGFDEMATTGWGGSLNKVRDHRYSGMALIRKFISESLPGTTIFIAGRHNFFDSSKEMIKSLGLADGPEILRTSDFTDEQAAHFLKNSNISVELPDWMPRRPLLLAYLAKRGFLDSQVNVGGSGTSPAKGWDHLLAMICEREAQQDERLDPDTVRLLIERLATIARSTEDGRGRIDILTIQNTFRDVAGFPPDETAQQFILRLPALGPTSLEDTTRQFVDDEIAGAARSGDVVRYIEHPYGDAGDTFKNAVCPLGELGTNIVSEKVVEKGIDSAVFGIALARATEQEETQQLAMDLAVTLIASPEIAIEESYKVQAAVCSRLMIDDFSRDFSSIEFSDCLFSELEVSQDVPKSRLPMFNRCIIGTVDGFFGSTDLPSNFSKCDVTNFAFGSTTAAEIMRADIPEGLKLLMTVLRKLFLQKGAGRQENALYRGAIDARSRRLIPEIMQVVARHGIAEYSRYRARDSWLPNRAETDRVRKILRQPMTSNDPLVLEIRNL
jgi:hypothetical protein